MNVDEEGFKKLMQEQRVRAREARAALGDLGWAGLSFGKEIPETVLTAMITKAARRRSRHCG